MRLLFITQKMDRVDPKLHYFGFLHKWVELLAKEFEYVTVICLEEGEHDLPENVSVLSLGKEKRESRVQYITRFFRYIIRERKNYDVVFVHMNQEYVLLAGLLWWLWGKKVGLWYNHTYGTWKTRVAMMLVDRVFHTSPFAFTSGTKKSRRMPAGIDTDIFKPVQGVTRHASHILYVGRLAPLKYVDVLIDACVLLKERGVPFVLDVYGTAQEDHKEYEGSLHSKAGQLEAGGQIVFHGGIQNDHLPEIYSAHGVFVNLTGRGNFDKTPLEAMACESLVVVGSDAFSDMVDGRFVLDSVSSENLANALERTFSLSEDEHKKEGARLRQEIVEKHNVSSLVKKIRQQLYEATGK